MKCIVCNNDVNDTDNFCVVCGSPMSVKKESKVAFILALISAALTLLGINIVINVLIILIAISSIVLSIVNNSKKYRLYSICLSLYAIIASVIWLLLILS